MKKVLVACVAATVLGAISPASAADLPRKAPVLVEPVSTWTGWYIGGNVGYGIGGDPSSEIARSGPAFGGIPVGTALYGGLKTFDVSSKGFLGGVQAGYNWETASKIVLGIEADIQGSNIRGTANCVVTCGTGVVTVSPGVLGLFPVVFGADNVTHKIDWFGTVRGRVGYSTGRSLFYATGGLAYGNVQRTGNVAGRTTTAIGGATVNTFTGNYNVGTVKTGWTVGGGLESMLSKNWSVKAEYLYVDLGSTTDVFNTNFQPGGAPAAGIAASRTDTASYRDHIVRVGLNYGFH